MLSKVVQGVGAAATSVKVLGKAGVIRPYSPAVLARLGLMLREWGTGPAGGFASLAIRHPDAVGIIDERGQLTWGELHRRSNALARGLAAQGVGEGDAVAVMCRNHRGFVETSIATAKLGADVLYLNTAFSGPQLRELLERDRPEALVLDEEFSGLLEGIDVPVTVLGWCDDDAPTLPTLDGLIADHDAGDLSAPGRHGRIIILTSGTTGTPKGAPRSEAGVDAAVSLLSLMPLHAGWRTHVAAPLFHTWGFGHMALGLQRILALPAEVLDRYDLSRVEVVASSGSALPGELALTWMDRFGDNLYSTYGSTEVAYAAIAGPRDLREAPSTAGRPPYATVVRILDDQGRPVPDGEPGRIFVGNGLLFEGYTGGGSKEVVDGLMSTGDVGRFREDGRLYVEGRDDEMIVSGGENVFPKEVEDCIARHDEVVEAAAVGVEDDEFGQRLRAFVVRREGSSLDEEGVKGWVKENLARYKVPRDVVFLDELPRNATGKVLKRELSQRDDA